MQHAVAQFILLLLSSARFLHAVAFEPDENAVEGVVLLQVDFGLAEISKSGASAALQPGTQKFSMSASHHNLVSSNASRDSLNKLDTKTQSKDIRHEVSLWPLVLLVIGTVGPFVAMLLFGRLYFPEKESASDSRECFADHAKWLLSGLVCWGHITQYRNTRVGMYQDISTMLASGAWSDPSNLVYNFTHMFMMQTFCFYSGHFSRSYAQMQQDEKGVIGVFVQSRKLQGNVLKILLVGEIMNILCVLVIPSLTSGPMLTLESFRFGSAGWYIYALVFWRMLVPTWKCVKYPIAASLLLVVLVTHTIGSTMARTQCYFPFFVMGLRLDPSVLRKTCSDVRVQISGVAFLCLILVALSRPASFPYVTCLRADGLHGADEYWGALHWPMYYLLCSLCVGSFLAAGQLPLRGSWGPLLDNMSCRSLYNYLGQAAVLELMKAVCDWPEYMNSLAPPLQLLFTLAISFMVLMILTSWPVYFVLSSVCEPNLEWLFEPVKPRADADTSGK